MRPIALLAFLLSTLAASHPTFASDFDFEPLQHKLSMDVQERIQQVILPALAARVEQQIERELAVLEGGPALPARIDAGSDPALAATTVPASGGSDAEPTRMTCRTSTEHTLECVVVSKRPGLERVAKVP
jgi:hypothetical protein